MEIMSLTSTHLIIFSQQLQANVAAMAVSGIDPASFEAVLAVQRAPVEAQLNQRYLGVEGIATHELGINDHRARFCCRSGKRGYLVIRSNHLPAQGLLHWSAP